MSKEEYKLFTWILDQNLKALDIMYLMMVRLRMVHMSMFLQVVLLMIVMQVKVLIMKKCKRKNMVYFM